jgi:hypothetical protein
MQTMGRTQDVEGLSKFTSSVTSVEDAEYVDLH